MTADELLKMPHGNSRHELIKGELRTMSPAGYDHGIITMQLAGRLAEFVRAPKLGVVLAAETGFLLSTDPDTVRAPDVAFVCRERAEATGKTAGFWRGAPDLAVEFISPSDTYAEVEEKALEWLEAGTLAVVIINPRNETVIVRRSLRDITILTNQDILEFNDIVPGWSILVSELFA